MVMRVFKRLVWDILKRTPIGSFWQTESLSIETAETKRWMQFIEEDLMTMRRTKRREKLLERNDWRQIVRKVFKRVLMPL